MNTIPPVVMTDKIVMDTVSLVSHLVRNYPKLEVSVDQLDGFEVVGFMDGGCFVTDPIEMEHRGLADYFGPNGLTKADAQIISDFNEAYNEYLCS